MQGAVLDALDGARSSLGAVLPYVGQQIVEPRACRHAILDVFNNLTSGQASRDAG